MRRARALGWHVTRHDRLRASLEVAGGEMTEWLVGWISDLAVWIRTPIVVDVLCSWTKNFPLTTLLFTQKLQWVLTNCWSNSTKWLQKSAFLNSNSIGNSRAMGFSVIWLLCATLVKQSWSIYLLFTCNDFSQFMLQKAQLLSSLKHPSTLWKHYWINHVSVFGFQFLKDGYAAHLTALSTETISRPAVGNSRLILRRGCFGLPSRASKTRHKIKRSISDKPSIDSDKECSSTLSGTFNYSSFRHTKGRSVSKFD